MFERIVKSLELFSDSDLSKKFLLIFLCSLRALAKFSLAINFSDTVAEGLSERDNQILCALSCAFEAEIISAGVLLLVLFEICLSSFENLVTNNNS